MHSQDKDRSTPESAHFGCPPGCSCGNAETHANENGTGDAAPARATIALAGNPNCGKTTLFNTLTGSRQRVGNWPGVTVERLEGTYQHDGTDVKVVDLPGIYSFSAYAVDETIARQYILTEKPAVVVNIVDATNLERNLFLTTQLLEMKVPVVVALNMMDLAEQRRLTIEIEHLSRHLDCPVVPIVASKARGIPRLKDAIAEAMRRRHIPGTHVEYDQVVEEAIETLRPDLDQISAEHHVNDRWLAIKLLEQDKRARELAGDRFDEVVSAHTERVERHIGQAIDVVMADGRYGFIHGLAHDVLRNDPAERTISDAVDSIVLNRVIGIPVFLFVMYLVFALTINVGKPFIDFFDILCGTIFVDGFRALLESVSIPPLLITMLADGAGGGVRVVATFIPPIFFIFFCLAILEDSGYMARAAFVMDRLLRQIGLPGKAFLPMLIGFGCNVPGIMATRTLENKRDRIVTVLINPFMSCGARLPVYMLFAVAFFPDYGGVLIFSLYIIGILLGVLTGLMLKSTVLQSETATFVMELPHYHMPTVSGIMHHTWHRLRSFITRAGKIIILMVIVLSMLNAIGTDGSLGKQGSTDSVLAAVGRTVTPVLAPMGISNDNWPATVSLCTGLLAKEAIVGTLDNLYTQLDAAGQTAEQSQPFEVLPGIKAALVAIPEGLKEAFWPGADRPSQTGDLAGKSMIGSMQKYFGSKWAAMAYLLFVLSYAPCAAAVAAICRETGAKWAVFSVLYMTGLAWIAATVLYQLGTFFEHPSQSMLWLAIAAVAVLIFHISVKLKARAIIRT